METNGQTGRRTEGEKGLEMEAGSTGASGGEQASAHLCPLCLFSPVPISNENTFVIFLSQCTVSKAFQSAFFTLYAS